ncbi:MAG: 1,4-dihydroxy-2-naphthoate polyprenyltransferase [Myxococcota bacterium]|nr:1,4-dihydroxy-2-naphthoate polyprenyltransferase [Myxococcota bacterium]
MPAQADIELGPAQDAPPGLARTWFLAVRPRTLPAAVTPVLVGSALAYSDGVFHAGYAALAAVGAVLIQVGTNLFNDYADFKRGADTAERLGPARVTQRGWVTPRAVLIAAVLAFALAMLVGVALVARGGWPIVAIGLASVACGFLYTGGPAPLAYLGIADLFVFAFFGLVAVGGTYYVQALRLAETALYAGAALGALCTAVLVVNNLRDRVGDARAGKRTLAVRFGARFARGEYVFLLAVAYAIPVVGWAVGATPVSWLVALLTLPLAVARLRGVLANDGAALNRYLGGTAQLMLVYGVVLAAGVTLWR